jgi:uncharacterized protein (TIGR02246 family)
MTDHSPDAAVRALYRRLLDCWDRRDGLGFAALFSVDGSIVGFDGSSMNGRREIAGHLASIFKDHPTPVYVAKIREVRLLSADVVLLRAVAGLIPRGASDIEPRLNAIQSLLARNQSDGWRIELFQNTPAAFHGQPALAAEITAELRALLS